MDYIGETMKLIVKYQHVPNDTWLPHFIFDKIFDALVETYTDIEFIREPEHFINKPQDWTYCINPHTMEIKNPETNKKIMVSYADINKSVFLKDPKFGWDIKNIVQYFITSDFIPVFTAPYLYKNQLRSIIPQFNNVDLELEIDPSIFVPFSYPVWDSQFELFASKETYKNLNEKRFSKNRKQQLHFRGYLWEPRKLVLEATPHPEISYTDTRLSFKDYAEELIEYRCGLSLNGNAEICNRDIELMSMGMPILRPELKCSHLHDPLIPNFHYVSFDFERQPFNEAAYPGAPLHHNAKLVSDAMIDRWESVKYDYDFLDFVGYNAKQWYNKNGNHESHVRIFMEKVNFNLLK